MDCKEAEQLVEKYIKGDLEGKQLKNFIAHVKVCRNCFEELEIHYVILEGLQQLESGATIHIGREISGRLLQSERMIRNNYLFHIYYILIQAVAYFLLFLILFLAV